MYTVKLIIIIIFWKYLWILLQTLGSCKNIFIILTTMLRVLHVRKNFVDGHVTVCWTPNFLQVRTSRFPLHSLHPPLPSSLLPHPSSTSHLFNNLPLTLRTTSTTQQRRQCKFILFLFYFICHFLCNLQHWKSRQTRRQRRPQSRQRWGRRWQW